MNSQSLGDNKTNFQTLELLWENANVGFDSNDFDAAMTNLNAAVTSIQENVLARILLKRATTQKCRGNLQESIQDAYRVIELAPRSMDGYLFAGTVLSTNGRYGEAMAVYSKGICALQESSDSCDHYLESDIQERVYQLIQAKRAVQWDMDRTNTYLFKKLPLELTHDIFANLISFQDRVQCMYTCRSWQTFLLDELPRMSHRLVLGSMPKQAMIRLVNCYADSRSSSNSNEKDVAYYGGGDNKMKNGKSVSILPGTSPLSFKYALQLLSNSSSHIGCLEILTEWGDKNRDTKSIYIRTLRQNQDTLKSLTVCSVTDTMVTVNAIDNCPNLSHLVVAANHILLESDDSSIPSSTFRGKKLCSTSHKSKIEYGRDVWWRQQQNQGNSVVDVSANAIWLAETAVRRQNAGITRVNYPIKPHLALRRLELVGVEIGYFFNPLFWSRLPVLEYLAIKEPVGLRDDFTIISRCIRQHCHKLKTFRFGAGWDNGSGDNWNEKKGTRQLRNQQENKEQFALRELIACSPCRETINGAAGNVIFSLLVSSNNCEFLQVLILQMDTLAGDGLEKLVGLQCPHLRDLQLHQRWIPLYNNVIIEERHTTAMVKNCPALERVVLNGTKLTPTSLTGFKNASRLRSLSILPWYSSINDLSGPRNGNLNQSFNDNRLTNDQVQLVTQRRIQAMQRRQNYQQQQLAAYRLPLLMRRQPNGQNEEYTMQQQSEASRTAVNYTYAVAQQPPHPYAFPPDVSPEVPRAATGGIDTVNRLQRALTQRIFSTRRNLERLRANNTINGNTEGEGIANGTHPDIGMVSPTINGVTITTNFGLSQPTESIFNNCIHNYKVLTELCIGGETFTDANLATLITKNYQLTSIKLIKCSSLTSNGIVNAFSSSSSSSSPSSSRLLPALQYLRHITLMSIILDKPAIVSIARLPRLKELVIIECDPLGYNEILEILNDEQQCYEYLPTASSQTTTTTTWIKHNGLRTYFIPYLYIPNQSPESITYIFDCIPGRSSVITKTTNDVMIAKPILGFI